MHTSASALLVAGEPTGMRTVAENAWLNARLKMASEMAIENGNANTVSSYGISKIVHKIECTETHYNINALTKYRYSFSREMIGIAFAEVKNDQVQVKRDCYWLMHIRMELRNGSSRQRDSSAARKCAKEPCYFVEAGNRKTHS